MSEQKHIIKRQIIELTVDGPAEARRLQSEASRLYRQRIVPLIDRYCTELSQPDRIHRIESLELDLGHIDPAHFETDFVAKLGPALRRALADQIKVQEQVAGRHQGRSPKTTSQLELFALFARTGSLPWWADASRPQLLEECLRYLLSTAPESLRRLMRGLVQERRPLPRLVQHYADEHLAALAGFLATLLESGISRDSQRLLLILQKTRAVADRRPAQLRQSFWTNMLYVSGLESRQVTAFEPFYEAVLTRIAADLGLTYRTLVTDIGQVIQEDGEDFPLEFRDTLDRLYRELPHAEAPAQGKPEAERPITRTKPEETITKDLARQLERLQAARGSLVDLWTALRILAPRLPVPLQGDLATALEAVDSDLLISDGVSPDAVLRILMVVRSGLTQQHLRQITPLERRQLLAALQALAGSELFSRELSELTQTLRDIVSRETVSLSEADDVPLDLSFSEAEELYIGNAGLVILWPFLSHFFTRLDLLTEKQFKDSAARQRAVGLLQHIATAEAAFPEYLLPLNKVLCGLELTEVFDFGPPLSELEAEECANLLTAVIEQAAILRDMSVAGFRGTFLLRQGVLTSRDGAWLLQVERETYDIVLDRFPWGWEWVKLPWMEASLRVEW